MSFIVLSHSLYHVPTTFFHHQHTLTVRSVQKPKHVGEFPNEQCKQFHRVSFVNSAGITLIAFFLLADIESLKPYKESRDY